ncbi:hypothetical protein KY285_000844 [Solanum tuberosum]|nr:hypothetical protein KY289_001027 [Solanum tuberosum]KAH0764973.1 hypothetical protein KY285_000844 [Solanum tuberosum]
MGWESLRDGVCGGGWRWGSLRGCVCVGCWGRLLVGVCGAWGHLRGGVWGWGRVGGAFGAVWGGFDSSSLLGGGWGASGVVCVGGWGSLRGGVCVRGRLGASSFRGRGGGWWCGSLLGECGTREMAPRASRVVGWARGLGKAASSFPGWGARGGCGEHDSSSSLLGDASTPPDAQGTRNGPI